MIKLDDLTEIEIKDGILTISQFDNNEVILTQDNLKKLLEAINFIQCCDKLPQDPVVLARYLHEAYEMIAKKQNWNTQENCKVDFSDLPIGNKNTMILLAGKLILDFGGN